MQTTAQQNSSEDGAGLFSMDIATELIYADEAVADAFGFPEEAAKRGIPRQEFYDRIAPEYRSYIRKVIATSVETGEQIQISYTIIRPDGSRVKALGFGQCFRSSCGKPLHYAGIVVPLSGCDDKPGNDVISHLLAAHESALQLGSMEGAQKIIEAITLIMIQRGALPVRH